MKHVATIRVFREFSRNKVILEANIRGSLVFAPLIFLQIRIFDQVLLIKLVLCEIQDRIAHLVLLWSITLLSFDMRCCDNDLTNNFHVTLQKG